MALKGATLCQKRKYAIQLMTCTRVDGSRLNCVCGVSECVDTTRDTGQLRKKPTSHLNHLGVITSDPTMPCINPMSNSRKHGQKKLINMAACT